MHGQYTPGETYFGSQEFVEYQFGNLPIILVAPHGGEKTPLSIPDRECSECILINDAFTQELTRSVANKLHQLTGCFPHVVYNRLHRSKLDANRDIIEAAGGNLMAEEAWTEFHAFIETASLEITTDFNQGIYFDVHGHAHDVQRLELGYLLTKSELQLDDDLLNDPSIIEKSSIRNLANSNLTNTSFSDLIRGLNSFGGILNEKDYRAVPSYDEAFPENNEPYFSGGYNTRKHGSSEEGMIDAIQVECNQDVRFTESLREEFADSLALSILSFLETHYFENSLSFCLEVSTLNVTSKNFEVFPNPSISKTLIRSDDVIHQIILTDLNGNHLWKKNVNSREIEINLSSFNNGIYFLQLHTDKQFGVRRILKN